MTGSIATNLHEGSRSELLADYLFSGWGTITPVRRQDDHGIDLYGGLAERHGQRSIITDYYVVQVKSTTDPWTFIGEDSVRWLVDYPIPIFLACVDKKEGTLAIYHVTSRFHVSVTGKIPSRLELVPDTCETGVFVNWEGGDRFSLSAPILRVTLSDLLNAQKLAELRTVFTYWVRLYRDNIDLLRFGLLRFLMPSSYKVNHVPEPETGEFLNSLPSDDCLKRGIRTLVKSVEFIGGQLGQRGDRRGALLAALLADHILQQHADLFADIPMHVGRLSGLLNMIVANGLNKQLNRSADYVYDGLAQVQKCLDADPLVNRFLNDR